MLSTLQIAHYHSQGYVVIDNALSPDELTRLKSQAAAIIHKPDSSAQQAIFSTHNNDRSGNDYFLESAEKVRCFYEEEAFDTDGNLVQSHDTCINKIGHALHELDPVFSPISRSPRFGQIAKALGMQQPQIRQSMYIFKQPRIGGEVNWHQDATFFYTTPGSVITYWFAIEDATLENGCLWVEPEGHNGPLRQRFNRSGDVTTMETLDDMPWPETENAKALEVPAGTLVCFHGRLPHYSAPNRSEKSRQAYTLHVTDGATEYANSNWLQAVELPLRGFDSS